jgi:hypothetical protein
MRPNTKEPESAPLWYQMLAIYFRPHGGLLQQENDYVG